MGDMAYLIAGYSVFAVVTLVYIYSLISRQKNLRKELETIKAIQESE